MDLIGICVRSYPQGIKYFQDIEKTYVPPVLLKPQTPLPKPMKWKDSINRPHWDMLSQTRSGG